MGFFLFLLVIAVLFLRPADLVPGLEEEPIYEVVILACMLASIGSLVCQFKIRFLRLRPITVCILGLMAAVVLSHLSHLLFTDALVWGFTVFKVVVLYLLLVANVDSFARLRVFLAYLGFLMLILAGLSSLQYHGFLNIPALEAFGQKVRDPQTGELLAILPRICGPGIFHDPNDLCVILVIGMILCLYWLGDRRLGIARFVWLVPLVLFAHGVALSHSRGGFIALVLGLFTLLKVRIGGWKAVFLGILILPLLLIFLGGRQTQFDLSDKEDTSQYRIRLWSDGLVLMRETPLFGQGQGTYEDRAGQVAHNSFVETFTELGLFGGTLFLGAFAYALWTLNRVSRKSEQRVNPSLKRASHYLMAMVAALVGGMLSLSRVFNPPTFIILGLVTAYLRLVSLSCPQLAPQVTRDLLVRAVVLSALTLLATHTFVQLVVLRWN